VAVLGEEDESVGEQRAIVMKSPVGWALLGLVIERESYAFELARRFRGVYRDVLRVSSASHVYTALTGLQERGLVEQLPGMSSGRQPKPTYAATALGVQSSGQWLIGHVDEDRRRQAQFVLGLSALAGSPGWVGEVIDGYERAWIEHGCHPEPDLDGRPDGPGTTLLARTVQVENQLTVTAKLAWVRHLRKELETHNGPQPSS